MTSYRVATSLEVLRDEINTHAPNRDKTSDGAIGDEAHRKRSSRHNPNEFDVVTARDFDHDPAGGLDCHQLAEDLRALGAAGDERMMFGGRVIFDRQVTSADDDWQWREYKGTNPHEGHLHVQTTTVPAVYDSDRPWRVLRSEPIPPEPTSPKPIPPASPTEDEDMAVIVRDAAGHAALTDLGTWSRKIAKPERDDLVNAGVKELAGNDAVYARALRLPDPPPLKKVVA